MSLPLGGEGQENRCARWLSSSLKKMVWQVWLIDLDDLGRFLLRCCFQTFGFSSFLMRGCDPQSPSRRRTTARQAEGPHVLIGHGLTIDMDFSIM